MVLPAVAFYQKRHEIIFGDIGEMSLKRRRAKIIISGLPCYTLRGIWMEELRWGNARNVCERGAPKIGKMATCSRGRGRSRSRSRSRRGRSRRGRAAIGISQLSAHMFKGGVFAVALSKAATMAAVLSKD